MKYFYSIDTSKEKKQQSEDPISYQLRIGETDNVGNVGVGANASPSRRHFLFRHFFFIFFYFFFLTQKLCLFRVFLLGPML